MEQETTPYYPEQGNFVAEDALWTLLPAGLAVADARILFVHAHPDDESTSTGATMGYYAAEGAQVDLLTMTRGELGEVIPQELAHLEVGKPGCTDRGEALGDYRAGELSRALEVLGVKNHLFLGQGVSAVEGAPAIFRDSGMAWGQDGRAVANPVASADCLTALDLDLEARAIAAVIRELRPQVVVTYDNGGGYGHPDHVRTYEATLLAVELLAGTDYEPALLWGLEGDSKPDDSRQQAVIDGSLERKRAAMEAHATQVIITGEDTFQYSNLVTQKISARETYRLLKQTGRSA